MSADYHFFIERFTQGYWSCPLEFTTRNNCGETIAEPLFTIRRRSFKERLFFHDNALVEFNNGFPPLKLSEEVFARINGSTRSEDVWWIEFDGLMFETWSHSFAIVKSKVEKRYVDCFGNGTNLYPEDCLKNSGMDVDYVSELQKRRLPIVDDPIDKRYEFSYSPDKTKDVEVTWSKSIASILGADIMRKITEVRKQHGDEKLRFVVGWG